MIIYDEKWNALTESPDLSKGHLEVRVFEYDEEMPTVVQKYRGKKNRIVEEMSTEIVRMSEERLVYVVGTPTAKSESEERMDILENAILELAEILGGE